ncbi:MAG: hypothetical protein JST50_01420 [Bacteroidetes bacterium]|jgi:hypothetical protein|nr:hypothetical protein [Bacteroidota bacterium]
MKVDAREILFIRQNAPVGMIRTLANNINIPYAKVRNELHTLKEDYPDELVIEARRLLEANTGLVYQPCLNGTEA